MAISLHQCAVTLAIIAMLMTVSAANRAGLITGNPTTSVPRGLYYAVSPEKAAYVTFCLDHRHRDRDYYPIYCSAERPNGLRILKRITERRPDGSLIVEGDSPGALDSRLLGPVRSSQIHAWWRPLILIDREKNT